MSSQHPSVTTEVPPAHGGLREWFWRRPQARMALLLVPLILYLVVLFYLPLIGLLRQSLFDPTFMLDHYVHLATVPVYSKVLARTTIQAFFVTGVCLLLAYPLSFWLSRLKGPFADAMLLLVTIPQWTTTLITMFAWMQILGRRGMLNDLLMALGLISEPTTLLYNTPAAIMGMVYALSPFMILVMVGSMSNIDWGLVKAARTLGAGPVQAFFKVYFPLSLPGVVSGCLLVFVLADGMFITPALLGGPSDMTIAMLIEDQVTRTLNWGLASANATVLLLTTVIVLYIYNRFLGIDKLWGGVR